MIPKECKRLAEVDFPIAEVSKHAAREKSIRHGHPSTLHLWWARRPLASSRAVLMALLLPDPCDAHCPDEFKQQAREILTEMRQTPKSDMDLRKALLWFIGAFANWDVSADPLYLQVARNLVSAAHPEEPPLVVDPFAGGGSIPLEALRIGCEAFATDLNPVACLILKVMLEDIPRHGSKLADELRRVGGEIKAAAQKELTELYPADRDGATPIAYLWARTVQCETPNCGAEIPLLRSLWLCKKMKRKWALRTKVVRPKGAPPQVKFEIFEPVKNKEVAGGTVDRAKAKCLCCNTVLPPDRVRSQLSKQKGGADVIFDKEGRRTSGARMIAVALLRDRKPGRHYRLPIEEDYAAIRRAQERLKETLAEWRQAGKQGLCPIPNESTPVGGGSGAGRAFSVQKYGMMEWGDLFTARQKMALMTFSNLFGSNTELPSANIGSLCLSKMVDMNNNLSSWQNHAEIPAHMLTRYAIPMKWDFSECAPLSGSSGSPESSIERTIGIFPSYEVIVAVADIQCADATDHPLPDQTAGVWFTDPPYYDAVPYSDISDFFLIWLKRTMPDHPLLRDPFDSGNPLSPKTREAVQDETRECDGRIKNREFFEDMMGYAFAEGRRILCEDGIGSVVFAHKTTEGWEALLSGMVKGGWTITGSWPLSTEMTTRLRARDSAALATSVHLICRPRPEDAPIGDWADVLRELPRRVSAWIERLQNEGIRGADLVFACIGPALEIFSRYRSVETAEGREVGLPEFLEKVWEVVGRAALERVLGSGDTASGALEEDARLTALFLWTLQSTDAPNENGRKKEDDEETIAKAAARGFSLPFDVVRRFAQPMGIDLDVWTGRTIAQDKGIVRLLPVAERAMQLFGASGANAAAEWIEKDPAATDQLLLFPEMESAPKKKKRGAKKSILDPDPEIQSPDATTLDRVHAAILLQQSGQTNALRALLKAEQNRGPAFLRLSNALSALYPKGAEEKRLLDAMLLAVPR